MKKTEVLKLQARLVLTKKILEDIEDDLLLKIGDLIIPIKPDKDRIYYNIGGGVFVRMDKEKIHETINKRLALVGAKLKNAKRAKKSNKRSG